ncbi:general secretion pathway protein GspB [Shewanella sp.]|nr:general secretion pathway protein GspB [Shewanella sp.]
MSILLDAVTRDKQQSQAGELDLVTPVPSASAQRYDYHSERRMIKRTAFFVALFGAIIALAWLLSDVLAKPHTANAPALDRAVNSVQLAPAVTVEATFDDAGIKLAGKAPLPVAQARPSVAVVNFTDQTTAAATEQVGQQEGLRTLVSTEPNTGVSNVSDPEPIILGKNANQRGKNVLASLQYEVDLAAAEVGLGTDSTVQDNNNLVAAFEAALKDVEREHALATPVSRPNLDPIPTVSKSDSLPKYGQLPAGLQLQVPEFNINAHVYSSNPSNRWLNVDGQELQQGDKIQNKLTVVEIRPRDVVLSIEGTEFKVPAI